MIDGEDGLNETGKAALSYVRMGWAVIPLRARSKVPAVRNGLNGWTDDPESVVKLWTMHPEFNVAVVCGQPSHGLVVVDVDVDEDTGEDGLATLHDWETTNCELLETVTAITGRGGVHYLYMVDHNVRKSENKEMGVDVRGDGSYFVAPPSIHPNGRRYEWEVGPDERDVSSADANVLSFIDHVRPGGWSRSGEVGERPADGDKFKLPETIGNDRNSTLFKYACHLRAIGRVESEISDALYGANATRCKPPLDRSEVRKIINSSVKYQRGGDDESTGAISHAPHMAGVAEKAQRLKDVTSLEICEMLSSNSDISNGIKFDLLEKRPWKVAPLPWDTSDEKRRIDDRDVDALWGFMEFGNGVRNKASFFSALNQFYTLDSQKVNPLQDLMGSIGKVTLTDDPDVVVFDGERVMSCAGMLMSRYLGVDLTEYTYEVERLMLREIVARAIYPGCKADNMVVLVGAQGIGKSTFVGSLALDERFYLERFSRFDTEDLKRLPGKLVVEVPELDGFGHADMSAIKSVITTRTDTYRASYARYTDDWPRSCVFVGTTNDSAFLTDTTGNRRFLPVMCNASGGKANEGIFDGRLESDVRQAMGETVALLDKLGRTEFLSSLVLPQSVSSAALEKQEQFTQEDDLTNDVQSYLSDLGPNIMRVNVKMVMFEAMGYDKIAFSKESRYKKSDVADAINRCEGWKLMPGKQLIPGFGTAKTWERG